MAYSAPRIVVPIRAFSYKKRRFYSLKEFLFAPLEALLKSGDFPVGDYREFDLDNLIEFYRSENRSIKELFEDEYVVRREEGKDAVYPRVRPEEPLPVQEVRRKEIPISDSECPCCSKEKGVDEV
ncbi:V2 [Sesame yellow mosaic virus]|uniref:V2 n=1 Tax=Sesame yellow mosaic virus TaxID=2231646 RepID=A0A2Z4FSA7_9GEMI|nr:V2 [Sesame yellow mosaic virus]AWV91697.1 V2 [Sesame yellow mosaic virus]